MARIIRKISIILFPTSLIILLLVLIIITSKKDISDNYYTILENKGYVMDSNRYIDFKIYSKKDESLLKYKEENIYTLILDNMSLVLNDIDINLYDLDEYYLYKIEAAMPLFDNNISSFAYLNIKNKSFDLNLSLGTISFLNKNKYKLLSIDSLYASYSIFNNEKHLSGINIKLTNDHKFLTEVKLGEYNYGQLSNILFDKNLDNEIDIYDYIPKYKRNYLEKNQQVSIKSKTFFIPISTNNSYLTKETYITFKIDNELYYLDTFIYMVGETNPDNYESIYKLGDLNYV